MKVSSWLQEMQEGLVQNKDGSQCPVFWDSVYRTKRCCRKIIQKKDKSVHDDHMDCFFPGVLPGQVWWMRLIR